MGFLFLILSTDSSALLQDARRYSRWQYDPFRPDVSFPVSSEPEEDNSKRSQARDPSISDPLIIHR